jgi:hypothetical protein
MNYGERITLKADPKGRLFILLRIVEDVRNYLITNGK